MVRAVAINGLVVLGAMTGAVVSAALDQIALVPVWVSLAFVAGALLESRRWIAAEHQRHRRELERFATWAENALAHVPEDLDEDSEAVVLQLQADYQSVRRALSDA